MPAPLLPGNVPALDEGEGLVVFQVDTDAAVAEIALDRLVVVRNLSQGTHQWVVRLPAGAYRWKAIEFGAESGRRRRLFVDRLSVDDRRDETRETTREELRFEVVPRALNYPGAAIIRTSEFGQFSERSTGFRVRNHAAMAVRRLRETHPELLEAYPVHYAGTSGDTFLEHFEFVRRRVAASEPDSHRPVELDRAAGEP